VSERPRFGLGTIVKHRDFGRGRVVAYDEERYVIVFPGGDAKTVAFSFDGLEAPDGAGDPELDRIIQAVRAVLGDHGWLDVDLELAKRWVGGTLKLVPGREGQPKDVPIEVFLKKLIGRARPPAGAGAEDQQPSRAVRGGEAGAAGLRHPLLRQPHHLQRPLRESRQLVRGPGRQGMRLLEGIRVIDAASFIAGPVATTVMADFGADVIKVEPPGGDTYRIRNTGYPPSAYNFPWIVDNRTKRAIAIDLRTEDGQRVLHRLVRDADVFVTNLPLDARPRLRVGWEDLAPLNPRLIYASVTAYGERGEEAARPGFDSTALWARTALMDLMRPSPDSPPTRSLPGMGDHPTGMSLFGAIMAALYQRERTGRGTSVATSLMANGLWWNAIQVQGILCGARTTVRPPREESVSALANLYRCRDGRWFLLSLTADERRWEPLARALGRADLLTDPRFATPASRPPARAGADRDPRRGLRQARVGASGASSWNRPAAAFGVVGTARRHCRRSADVRERRAGADRRSARRRGLDGQQPHRHRGAGQGPATPGTRHRRAHRGRAARGRLRSRPRSTACSPPAPWSRRAPTGA
jgi:formyl-CoA transferase